MDKEKYKDKRILLIRSWPSFFIEETSHLGRTPQASHHPPVAAPFPLLLQASLPVNTLHIPTSSQPLHCALDHVNSRNSNQCPAMPPAPLTKGLLPVQSSPPANSPLLCLPHWKHVLLTSHSHPIAVSLLTIVARFLQSVSIPTTPLNLLHNVK